MGVELASAGPCMRPCVKIFKREPKGQSQPKHHSDEGKAALGFGPDRIRTMVSMAIDSPHMAMM